MLALEIFTPVTGFQAEFDETLGPPERRLERGEKGQEHPSSHLLGFRGVFLFKKCFHHGAQRGAKKRLKS